MHVLFDLDGTLTDPKLGFVRSVQFALEKLNIEYDPQTKFEAYIGPPLQETFEILCEGKHSVDDAIAHYRERYATTGLLENEIYDGIVECLQRVGSVAESMLVATSKPTVYAKHIIDHFELDPYFDEVFGSNLDGTLADKTELIAHVLKSRAISPSNATMIGDRRFDMVGANNNGVQAIGVLWGFGSEEELRSAGADKVCRYPHEIYDSVFG